MGIIDIVEGSFPVQAAVIMPKIGPLKNTTLVVKTHGKEQMVYSLRSAVKSLETVIDHKKKSTIKLVLSDGSLIIGKADHKSIEEIKIAQALGPDAEPAVTTVRSIREKRNLKKAATADKNSVFKHPIKAILFVVKLLLLLISIPMIFGLIAGLSGSNEPSTPVAPPVVSLTPEQIAQREKAAQAQIAEQEKAAKAQRAAGYLDQVRAFVSFLTTEEEYFKTNKASDADMDKIRKTLVLIESLADSLNTARENKADLSAEDIKYLKGIETRLSSFQQRVLPGLRLAFGKQADKMLWEHDIDVSVSGTGNTIVTFIGGIFAANANIKIVQTDFSTTAAELRFKQTRYQWYKGSEGTYFKIDAPPDGKLAMFKFGAFQDMAAGYP